MTCHDRRLDLGFIAVALALAAFGASLATSVACRRDNDVILDTGVVPDTPANIEPETVPQSNLAQEFEGVLFVRNDEILFLSFPNTAYHVQRFGDDLDFEQSSFFLEVLDQQRVQLSLFVDDWPSEKISGAVEGPQLTLLVPNAEGIIEKVLFVGATLADYNEAVSNLRQQVEQEAQAAETATAQTRRATADAEAATQAAYEEACSARGGEIENYGLGVTCLVFYPRGDAFGDEVTLQPDGSFDQEWADENREACESLAEAGFNAQYHDDTGVCIAE